jgi:hypothetical protein
VGGEMPCDRYRFEASIEKGIPLVVSVGALDMVNFGAKDTVPEQFKRRKLYVHNLQVSAPALLVRLCTSKLRFFLSLFMVIFWKFKSRSILKVIVFKHHHCQSA